MEKIEKFISVNNGSGFGSGSGSGSGSGFGFGSGFGSGSGDGLLQLNKHKVYLIDGIQTLIYSVKTNNRFFGQRELSVAKGAIINKDLSLTDCFIVKCENCFAHADTISKAVTEATNKALLNKPIEERISDFKERFKNGEKYPAEDFFGWHTILTGSCDFGKKSFIENNNIDMKKSYTVSEFVDIVKGQYGWDIISKIRESFS
jgi:hypothetical protein